MTQLIDVLALYRFGHIPLWWFRLLSVVVLAASEGCWALLRSPPPMPVGSAAGAPSTPAAPTHNQVAWAAHVCGALVGIPLAFLVFTGKIYIHDTSTLLQYEFNIFEPELMMLCVFRRERGTTPRANRPRCICGCVDGQLCTCRALLHLLG